MLRRPGLARANAAGPETDRERVCEMARKKAAKKTTRKTTTKKTTRTKKAVTKKVAEKPAKAATQKKTTAASKKKQTVRKKDVDASSAPGTGVRPTYDQIAARAYVVWERRGKPQGQDMINWREAEAELLAEAG